MIVWHNTVCFACKEESVFQVEITRREQEIPRACPCGHVTRFNYIVTGPADDRRVGAVPVT